MSSQSIGIKASSLVTMCRNFEEGTDNLSFANKNPVMKLVGSPCAQSVCAEALGAGIPDSGGEVATSVGMDLATSANRG
jgi:hypothetical protein